ncbi:MAG TPA: RsmB/NOP family class I SAM-dependent RNA methyltransferase [Candidatus Saccharimonadales bacterium]|nr:RsmB/NOP family class I SAM-dependent RNA methyltransferase [Candidatus Saccharimonadales bacterium]
MEKVEVFKTHLTSIFGDKTKSILDNLNFKPITFRINYLVNTAKILQSLAIQGFVIINGPLSNSYVIESQTKRLSETSEFKNGDIYIQSLASMLPAIILNPQSQDAILDLCAAPGSKTSQIANLTNNSAHIVAVENNSNRFHALKSNLEMQKITNVQVILSNGVGFDRDNPQFANYFDKVLVDAPCSNEGIINLSDNNALAYWNSKTAKKLSKLQKALLATGLRCLKKGGKLVYSTCTFSTEENEEVVAWALKKFPEMHLSEIKLPLQNTTSGLLGVSEALRILPDKYFTGFFVALFEQK